LGTKQGRKRPDGTKRDRNPGGHEAPTDEHTHDSHGEDEMQAERDEASTGRGGKGSGGGSGPESGRRRGRRRRRNDRGQYVEEVTADDILELFDRLPGPVLTTTDIAERYDITTEGARRKLNDLCGDGVLDRRKTGQTRVYWRVDGGQ
jgi:hypothetical protein